MIIKAIVELYTESMKEKVEILITKEDLVALAESKAGNEYACTSCQCQDIHIVTHERC